MTQVESLNWLDCDASSPQLFYVKTIISLMHAASDYIDPTSSECPCLVFFGSNVSHTKVGLRCAIRFYAASLMFLSSSDASRHASH